jgi:hypothetical protein
VPCAFTAGAAKSTAPAAIMLLRVIMIYPPLLRLV